MFSFLSISTSPINIPPYEHNFLFVTFFLVGTGNSLGDNFINF